MSGYFIGIVEDVTDPIQANRIKVRAFGYHNENKDILPTKDLPWAMVVIPVTQSGIPKPYIDPVEGEKFDGITTSLGLMIGNYVCGFFQDPDQQIPIILGSIPGFTDTKKDQTEEYVKVNDIPLAARKDYKESASYKDRVRLRETEVSTAQDLTGTGPVSQGQGGEWNQPDPDDTNKPEYPLNHVQRTQSGHVMELDDTPEFERIAHTHKSGTYHEIQATGDVATVIVGDNYTVIVKNDNILVKGDMNLTVEKNLKVHVQGDYHLEVEGNYHENIKGSNLKLVGEDMSETVSKSVTENYGGSKKETVDGAVSEVYNGTKNENVSGAVSENYSSGQATHGGPGVKVTASRIDLN